MTRLQQALVAVIAVLCVAWWLTLPEQAPESPTSPPVIVNGSQSKPELKWVTMESAPAVEQPSWMDNFDTSTPECRERMQEIREALANSDGGMNMVYIGECDKRLRSAREPR